LYALVSVRIGELRTRHYKGLPPDLTGGVDQRTLLPWPDVVLLEESKDGAMLYHSTRDAEFGGDTWHENIDAAKHQADFEFGESLGEWRLIPDEVDDTIRFVIQQARLRT